MRRIPSLLALLLLMSGCGDEPVVYSEETIQEWLGICMEGPAYEAYCRCQADAVAPLADEALFLEHIHSPLYLLPDEAIDEQNRLCDGLEPVLRADGVAGLAFGTALEPALDQLGEIFGEAEIVEAADCPATVAVWEGLQLTFSSADALVGWAYGAFQAGDDTNPLGLHAELHAEDGNLWVYTGDAPSNWALYYDLAPAPAFVADDPPTLILTAGTTEQSLRAITAGSSLDDPVIRLEAGTVCPLAP